MDRIALILTNYNMLEAVDAIASHVTNYVKWPLDMFIIDNGSNLTKPSKWSTLCLPNNIQTTRGWDAGFRLSDIVADSHGESYFAYWVMITSLKFLPNSGDVLTPMAELMLSDSNIVGVHASLDENSTTAWKHLKNRTNAPRQVWMLDNICTLWQADWFNSIGRFDTRMTYAWGVDLETSYLARKQGKRLYVHNEAVVYKETDIGYNMNRMGESADDRRKNAAQQMENILKEKYGDNWSKIIREDYVEDDWKDY